MKMPCHETLQPVSWQGEAFWLLSHRLFVDYGFVVMPVGDLFVELHHH